MIAIIDYGLGNLHSVYNAFKYLGYETIITNDENIILNADKVVLPGVGAFPDAMKTILKNKLDIVIKKIIKKKTVLECNYCLNKAKNMKYVMDLVY